MQNAKPKRLQTDPVAFRAQAKHVLAYAHDLHDILDDFQRGNLLSVDLDAKIARARNETQTLIEVLTTFTKRIRK